MRSPTLSLCMIVKNEEFFLADCLSQARDHVDEIILVDTGSTDASREIARQFTDEVYEFQWVDDFAAARNYSLEQASSDWVLVLDADELISDEGFENIRSLIDDTELDAFFLTERNYSDDEGVNGWLPVSKKTRYTRDYSGYQTNPIARLFRNHIGICYEGKIHEVLDRSLQEGQWAVSDIVIHHHGNDDPSKPRKERQLNYLRIMEPLLAEADEGRLYANAAYIRMRYLEDYPRAIQYLEKAIELGHQPMVSRDSLAEAQYRMGDLDQAYNSYHSLYTAGYRSFSACNNLANLAVKNGEKEFAAELLEAALGLGAFSTEVRERLTHNIRYLRSES